MDIQSEHLPNDLDYSKPQLAFEFEGPAGVLQALLDRGREINTHQAVAIVCHPHPLHGGAMTNKVTHTLATTLSKLGVPALRFNFRGVGKSTGEFDHGNGETDDLLAAIKFTQQLYPNKSIWLAGFSFGAYVALRGENEIQCERLITVAPAVTRFDVNEITRPSSEWLLIQGMDDEVVPAEAVLDWANNFDNPPDEIVEVAECSHFFHGKLLVLRDAVQAFCDR